MAKIFTEHLKKQVTYVDIPFESAKKSMLENGVPEFIADALNELSAVCQYNMMLIYAKLNKLQVHKSSQASHVTDSIQKVVGKAPLTFSEYVTQNARAFKTETTVFVSGATGVLLFSFCSSNFIAFFTE